MTSQDGTIIILGCGDSGGSPRIGNDWGLCDPTNPKNRRTRPSIAAVTNDAVLIVDTGPDFREQMNRERLTRLDAVLYTHTHGDHIHGIDDVRVWHDLYKKRIEVYGDEFSMADLKLRFGYIFNQKTPLYPPVAEAHVFDADDYAHGKTLSGIHFKVFEQDHGLQKSLGYRFGDVGYSTDMWNLEEPAINTLRGIKTWIVDGANLNQERTLVHSNLKTILRLNESIGAANVVLTHLKVDLDYDAVRKSVPDNMQPAYDGMKIRFDGVIVA